MDSTQHKLRTRISVVAIAATATSAVFVSNVVVTASELACLN